MRKLASAIISTCLVISLSICNTMSAYAADNSPDISENGELISDDAFLERVIEDFDYSYVSRGPASPLSSINLYAIFSEKAGVEYVSSSINDHPISSTLDHGGTIFRAITVEMGYAGTRFAYFNNSLMTLSSIEGFDLDNDSIIDGYFCLWTYSGSNYETGTFSANSTSVNYPWNTVSLLFYVN